MKVIYTGLPMLLCSNEECNTVDGFWSFMMDFFEVVIPFNGKFMKYEGNYWKALYIWLFVI